MYCKKCGNQLPDDAKFCGKCGNNVMGCSDDNEQQDNSVLVSGRKTSNQKIKVGIAGLLIVVLLICIFNIVRYETVYVLTEYESDYSRNLFTYDENGNCISMVEYVNGEGTSYKYTYTYDNNGNCISERVFDEDGQLDYTRSHEWIYDENGNCVEFLAYDEDGKIYVDRKWNYGENIIEEYLYYEDSKSLMEFSTYEYDEIRNRIKETNYYGENKEYKGYAEDTYDEKGNMLSSKGWDEGGIIIYHWQNEYDLSGNLVKRLNYDASGDLDFYYEYSYDEKGNMLDSAYWENEIKYNYTEFSYDEKGNRLTAIVYDENDEMNRCYKFLYDENENCIEELVNDESHVTRKYEALKVSRKDWSYGLFPDEREERNILWNKLYVRSPRATFIMEEL